MSSIFTSPFSSPVQFSAAKRSASPKSSYLSSSPDRFIKRSTHPPTLRFGLQGPNEPTQYVLSPANPEALDVLSKLEDGITHIPDTSSSGFFSNRRTTRLLNTRLRQLHPPEYDVVDPHLRNDLQDQKKAILNFYDGKIPTFTAPNQIQINAAVQTFVKQLDEEYGTSAQVFRLKEFGDKPINTLSKNQLEVYRAIVSMTAPLIFNMGFLDGIPHAGQVSRLAANQMRRFYREYRDPVTGEMTQSSQHQMLQAAIVGWLHDCKLDGKYSWDNLASHPMISSAVAWASAWHVLHQPSIQSLLERNLGLNKEERELFVQQIVEAISLNNDSYFVLQHAILGRNTENGRGDGIIRQMARNGYSPESIEHMERWAEQRFWAPSKSKSTDLSGPRALDLEIYCERNGVSNDAQTEMKNALNELTISTGLFDRQHKEIRVPVKYLLSHHDDVSLNARILSLCLEFADNLLLSPNKTVPVNPGPPINKIKVYLDSLDNNFACLPEDVREFQQPFHRAIMLSMLRVSDKFRLHLSTNGYPEVSTTSYYDEFQKITNGKKASYGQVEQDNGLLNALLNDPKLWGSEWSKSDITDPFNDDNFKILTSLFETSYAKMRKHYADVAMKNQDNQRFKFVSPNFKTDYKPRKPVNAAPSDSMPDPVV